MLAEDKRRHESETKAYITPGTASNMGIFLSVLLTLKSHGDNAMSQVIAAHIIRKEPLVKSPLHFFF